MDRSIVGFHQDPEGQWVAELACGHSVHVRHDPPWQVRPWVVNPEERRRRLGSRLACRACDDPSPSGPAGPETPDPASDMYTDLRLQGLCHDGALERLRKPPTSSG